MYVIFGIILFSTIAAAAFRRSTSAVLRQLWFEMGLVILMTVAMVASMFVSPASASEKSLVMLSVYSAELMIVCGGLHMAIVFARKARAR